jgi:hypothetical protein
VRRLTQIEQRAATENPHPVHGISADPRAVRLRDGGMGFAVRQAAQRSL